MAETETEPRWRDDRGISDLSIAIDEIYFLRSLLADEALIIEAHLGYATFPKSRRVIAEQQVERMRRVAEGELHAAMREKFNGRRALQLAGIEATLTNHQWAEQRGLVPNPAPTALSERREVGAS